MLSSKEKHSSYTKYHLSVAFKLTSAMFVNTAMIPLFVNLGKENWFVSSGLVVDTFYNTLSVGFISPLFYIINPVHIIKWIRQKVEVFKAGASKMTQRQANELFEGPPLDMAKRYANTMVFFMMIMFYSYLSPLLLLLGVFGVLYQFWIEKWVLLRRHKVPDVVGPTIAKFFANMIAVALLIYTLGVLGMAMELSDVKQVPLIPLIIVVIWLLIPIRQIIRCCNKSVARSSEEKDLYETQRFNFFSDYDRQNPITSKEAISSFLKEKAERTDLEEGEAQEIQEQLNQIKQTTQFQGIANYGHGQIGLQNRVQFAQGGGGMFGGMPQMRQPMMVQRPMMMM